MNPIHDSSGLPLLGNLLEYRKRKIPFLSSLRDDGFRLTRFKLGGHQILLLKRPEDIIQVEHRNAKNYVKATMLRDLVGDGILMSEGEKWRKQRRLIQPRFHSGTVAGMICLMNERVSCFIDDLTRATEFGQVTDELGIRIKRLTFEIILKALFGEVNQGDFEKLRVPMEYINFFLTYRFNEWMPLPLSFPFPKYRKFNRAKEEIDQVIFSYIRSKQKEIREGNPGSDLLTQMMTSIDSETGQGMGSEQLRDESVSLLLAGFETTGHLIPWVLGLLLQNPDSLRKLRDEIEGELKGEVPSAEDVFRLGYLNSVFDETLRLYPSVWAWTKRSLGEDQFGEVQIKKGEIIFVSPFLVHRDPSLWVEPDRFNPDRWTSDLRDQNKGAYFPFGLGPRNCVGKHFALLEAKLIVIRILQGFDFDFIHEDAMEPHFQITLGLKRPLQVRIRQRSRR